MGAREVERVCQNGKYWTVCVHPPPHLPSISSSARQIVDDPMVHEVLNLKFGQLPCGP